MGMKFNSVNSLILKNSDSETIDGLMVNFIDIENFKKNKQAVGRLQDLADLENLK